MKILADLARMPGELEQAVGLFASLHWTPASWEESPAERFSAIGHLCHVRDIEIDGYHVRFTRLLREENPDLVSLDGYAMARKYNYEAQAPAPALEAFRSARGLTIELIRDHWAHRERSGTFAQFGRISFEGLAHLLRSHDLQHLAGLHWLHAKARAASP